MIDFETKLDIRNALGNLYPDQRAIARKVMEGDALNPREKSAWANTIRPALAVYLDGVL